MFDQRTGRVVTLRLSTILAFGHDKVLIPQVAITAAAAASTRTT